MIIKGTSPEESSKELKPSPETEDELFIADFADKARKRIRNAGLMLALGPGGLLIVIGLSAGVRYIIKIYKHYNHYSAAPSQRLKARIPRIKKAPGSLLLRLVDFFYSPKTVENTFLPLVADWRNECFEALAKGRKWKERWISIRYRYRFIQVMGSGIVSAIIKIFKGLR